MNCVKCLTLIELTVLYIDLSVALRGPAAIPSLSLHFPTFYSIFKLSTN